MNIFLKRKCLKFMLFSLFDVFPLALKRNGYSFLMLFPPGLPYLKNEPLGTCDLGNVVHGCIVEKSSYC